MSWLKRIYHHPIIRKESQDRWHQEIPQDLKKELSEVLKALIPLLDGILSFEEIIGKLILSGYKAESILYSIRILDDYDLLEEASNSEANLLSNEELARYRMQMQSFANCSELKLGTSIWQRSGGPVQVTLKKANVLIVNMGVVGSNVVRSLALSGIGHITGIANNKNQDSCRQLGGWFDNIHKINRFAEFVELDNISKVSAFLEKKKLT
jgi:hypothetical protein